MLNQTPVWSEPPSFLSKIELVFLFTDPHKLLYGASNFSFLFLTDRKEFSPVQIKIDVT